MRLAALLFTAMFAVAPLSAQQPPPSSPQDEAAVGQGQPPDASGSTSATDQAPKNQTPGDPSAKDPPTKDGTPKDQGPTAQGPDLPVSLDRIKGALEQTPLLSLRTIDERPTFRVQIHERMKIAELLASLNFKSGPTPAGGVYMQEQQRVMFPSVDNPLVQPLAAFNQGELLTILVENLMGKYLAGRAMNTISKAERARAEAAAREEVHTAVEEYCNAQPNAGAGLAICSGLGR